MEQGEQRQSARPLLMCLVNELARIDIDIIDGAP